ncbi:hypothetical protein Vadar_018872 [Vaccinium darrowii]|uniref:Uncharacterized protein n=1 Tax=Vaccinium darrowii TaxID=229202 RepID=A0ACB7ZLE4_9ERIC|nr:hypothetical protein Vadar_018872 [Vaccinium darrowii]
MELESTPLSSKKTTDSMAPSPLPPPPPPPPPQSNRKRRRNICLVVIAVILGLVLLMVILGLTAFKAKHPVTTVNSVALEDLKLDLNMGVYLNVTLDVNLSIKNPNKVGFKYTNSSALLNYRGQVVGEAPIPASKISAGQTMTMNLTLTILADRLISNPNLYSDVVISGTLPLSTFTRISGKVRILKIIKIHVVAYTTCDINIDVVNRSVTNQSCQYKTKL